MQAKDAKDNMMEQIEALIVQKLPSPLKEEWIAINQAVTTLENRGEKRSDYPELMERMDAIMMSDEFAAANTQANNEVMGKVIDLQWMLDTAPRNE